MPEVSARAHSSTLGSLLGPPFPCWKSGDNDSPTLRRSNEVEQCLTCGDHKCRYYFCERPRSLITWATLHLYFSLLLLVPLCPATLSMFHSSRPLRHPLCPSALSCPLFRKQLENQPISSFAVPAAQFIMPGAYSSTAWYFLGFRNRLVPRPSPHWGL